jgi:hypothetical protein
MAEAAPSGTAMRYERVAMLNTGTELAPEYHLMGKGFESIDDKLNANVDEATYVSDKSASKTITGYSPEWGFDGAVIKDEETVSFLRAIGDGLATGAAAETDVIIFDVWDVDVLTHIVTAKRYPVVVQMESVGSGKGGEKLAFKGTLLGNGDPSDVDFNVDTSVIVPAGS